MLDMCKKGKLAILKASVKKELALKEKKLNCFIYTLSKTGKFPSFTFIFKVFQYRRILQKKKKSDIRPRNFNMTETNV